MNLAHPTTHVISTEGRNLLLVSFDQKQISPYEAGFEMTIKKVKLQHWCGVSAFALRGAPMLGSLILQKHRLGRHEQVRVDALVSHLDHG